MNSDQSFIVKCMPRICLSYGVLDIAESTRGKLEGILGPRHIHATPTFYSVGSTLHGVLLKCRTVDLLSQSRARMAAPRDRGDKGRRRKHTFNWESGPQL